MGTSFIEMTIEQQEMSLIVPFEIGQRGKVFLLTSIINSIVDHSSVCVHVEGRARDLSVICIQI